ncbi:hypothetical protein [Algicella marina]|uniref:Transmembrane protein n=1 Tax=Algicella marina TaxID=2683284 RepID=A0A6P1T2V5_9RHOB|nr:hypothetical protein [Algicella marina]QHQ35796.1 hypothetical protein GO499_11735 [Algicella marina]
MTARPPARPRHASLWHMVLAPVIWALHFAAIYGVTAIACAKADATDTARWTIFALSALALAGIALNAWRAWVQWDYPSDQNYVHDAPTAEHRREFLGHAGFLLSVVSAIGVVFATLPAVLIRSCL